ncbi:MAG: DUF3883 domain-containing protein [Cyanobacterium sp. T60_A2020_053]|nr:DUF3883 domain-containing protein [Cyanobacterium sp. T60_A2020_053]
MSLSEKQRFIEQLSKEKSEYKYRSQAEDSANSLDILSNDIYSESERFIYELIQNADDASDDSTKGVSVIIEFTDNFIIISHTGKEFTEKDIRSICGVGKSQKLEDPNKTGYKGIGFKSVFGKSNYVCIKSNDFCFRFDKKHWENKEYKMPWQIIPIWTDINNISELKSVSFIHFYKVSTIIKYEKTDELKQDLLKLLEHPQIMLFLRKVNKIIIRENSKDIVTVEKLTTNETITLKKNGYIESEWIKKDFMGFPISKEIQEKLKGDEYSPKKLKEAKYSSISFAAKVENNKIIPLKNDESLIFTYLPTKISLGFPFLINADFLTNAPREGFHEDRVWNQYLFEQVAFKLLEWLAELAKNPRYKYQISQLIPDKLKGYNKIIEAFNNGLNKAKNSIAFIPSESYKLLKISESLIDKTDINYVIGKESFLEYYKIAINKNISVYLVNHNIIHVNKLINFGVKEFSLKDIPNLFESDIFQSQLSIDDTYQLIEFLYNKAQDEQQGKYWKEKLPSLPFLFNQYQQLTSPNKPIYFPVEELDMDDEDDDLVAHNQELSFINEEVLAQISENKLILQWLQKDLNITYPTQSNILDKNILPNLDSLSETAEKSIQIVRYLFDAHKQGEINESNIYQLKNLYLITKNSLPCKLSEYHLYLSDEYEPELNLEEYLESKYFISSEYIRENDNIKDWNYFFVLIGVKEKIGIEEIQERTTISKLEKIFSTEYFDFLKNTQQYPFTVYPHLMRSDNEIKSLTKLTFVEETKNYKFSRFFWEKIVKNNFLLKISNIIQYYWGYGNRTGRSQGDNVEPNYLIWFLTHESCIPTVKGECYKAEEVIINRKEFQKIGGKDLSILDLKVEIKPELQKLFNFRETINLEEYLDVLMIISETQDEDKDISNIIERIGLIYQALTKYDQDYEKEMIKKWGESNKVMAIDNSFYSPQDLYWVDTKICELPANINNFVKLPKKDSEVINLLRLWGVKIITDEDLNFVTSEDKNEVSDLKRRLKSRLPLIALVSSTQLEEDWQNVFSKMSKILDETIFYEVSELYISCEQNGVEIFTQKRNARFNPQSQEFYFSGNWDSPRTLYSLTEELGSLLKNKRMEKELNLLILDNISSGLEWLKEQGYDTTQILSQYLEEEQEFILPTTDSLINNSLARSNEQKQFDAETGKLGEEFLYKELLEIIKANYQVSDNEFKNTEKGCRVEIRKENCPKEIEIVWENKNGESTKPYDFKVIKYFKIIENNRLQIKEQVIYIDSKATTTDKINNESIPFYLSPQEWVFMDENKDNYYIARVFNVRTNPYMSILRGSNWNNLLDSKDDFLLQI